MVFDRSLVAEDVLSLIDERGLKYISALDHDQIPNVSNIDLSIFKDLDSQTAFESIPKLPGFTKYDSDLYFKDLGITGDKRYIVGINPVRFVQDRKCRQEKIDYFQRFVASNNRLLKKAICVLSYFINRYLSQKRKVFEGKDFLNSKQLYEPLKSCKLVTLFDELSRITKKDIIPLSREQKEMLSGIVSQKMLKFTPIYSS